MKKYNKSEILKRAHEIRKAQNISLSEALRSSWKIAKEGESEETALDIAAQSLFRVRAMLDKLTKEEAALEETIKAAIEASGTDNITNVINLEPV